MKTKLFFFALILFINNSNIFPFSGKGSGSETDPYQITNVIELQEISNNCSLNAYFKLMNDIDATETKSWNVGDHDLDSTTPKIPMGFWPITFSGYLDGDGHIIKNLYIRNLEAGLFDYISFGYVKKLGIENCDISGSTVSSFCLTFFDGKIEECYSTGKIYSFPLTSSSDVAGFCGFADLSGIIENCYSECSINSDSAKRDYNCASFLTGLQAWKCYTIGKVSSNKKVSAFGQGQAESSNCFWDIEKTGIPDSGGRSERGLPTSEMYKQSTYYDWDFDSVWCIDEGKDYPKLQVFNKCTGTDIKKSETPENLDVIAIPNLTNGQTQILFSLPSSQRISIQIVNSLGIIQQVLINEEKYPAGNHSFLFDVSNLPNGLYFYSFKADAVMITKKFVILK